MIGDVESYRIFYLRFKLLKKEVILVFKILKHIHDILALSLKPLAFYVLGPIVYPIVNPIVINPIFRPMGYYVNFY